jgi:hypothetical protein
VNWSAPRLDATLALTLPTPHLLALWTAAFFGNSSRNACLLGHDPAGQLVANLDRPVFHSLQQAAMLSRRNVAKFRLQLLRYLVQSTS